MASDAESIADTVGFELVGSDLGNDVESALSAALVGGAVFFDGTNPLVIFYELTFIAPGMPDNMHRNGSTGAPGRFWDAFSERPACFACWKL